MNIQATAAADMTALLAFSSEEAATVSGSDNTALDTIYRCAGLSTGLSCLYFAALSFLG